MMMCLGQFVFGLTTLAFQELQRQTSWRHATTSRVGARAANQFLGVGDDTITLPGVIVPEFGLRLSLDEIHRMADTGAAWPLVDGTGRVYGQFVITEKSETGTLFDRAGRPARIEFSIALRRVDDNAVDAPQPEPQPPRATQPSTTRRTTTAGAPTTAYWGNETRR